MRRIQFLLTALALMAMMMVALSAPAMADNNDNNGDNNRHDNDRNDNDNCCNNFLDRHDDFGVFNDFSNDDEEDFSLTDVSPFFLGDDNVDVDFDNVGNNNDLEGECVLTDVDINGDGFIDDADVTCFV